MALAVERPSSIDGTSAVFAPLSDDLIARQTDAGSFSRGKTYFRGKRIFSAVRRGDLLRARCRGSSGGPYLVEANLAPGSRSKTRNPVRFHCNCPRGGFCKHVVALLLTWQERPETFDVRPPIGDLLVGKSREELAALIEAMVSSHPELEPMIALPPPATIVPGAAPVDESAVRRIIDGALGDPDEYDEDSGGHGQFGRYESRYGDEDYGDASLVAAELQKIVEYADAYVDGGFWRNASVVSAVLIEKLASEFGAYHDEEGELADLLRRSDGNLAACLEAQDRLPDAERFTPDERGRLIDAIVTNWEEDIAAGGMDLCDGGPEAIGALATAAEQERVRDRLRGMMLPAVGEPWKQQWHNRAVIGFLSLLNGAAGLSDEELLAEYRSAELWDDAATLLLDMGRADEAVNLASRKVEPVNALIAFADRLLATGDPGHVKHAIALIDDRLWEREGENVSHDQVLREWLETRYLEHGLPQKALVLAQGRFTHSPAKATYDAVKAAALHPGQPRNDWPTLRPVLIASLAKSDGLYALIDIHLEEGDVAGALMALDMLEKPDQGAQPAWGYSSGAYGAKVAAAAEQDYPDDAVRVYRRLADRLIAERGRANYQSAARFLARVMDVLKRNGRAEEWSALISELRSAHKSLRALREELDLLGLA